MWIRTSLGKHLNHRAIDVPQIAFLLKYFESTMQLCTIYSPYGVPRCVCVYIKLMIRIQWRGIITLNTAFVCVHMNRDSVTECCMIIIESSSVMSSSINLKVIYWSTNNRNNNNHLTCYTHDFQQQFFSLPFSSSIHSKQTPLDIALADGSSRVKWNK